jgi:ATP-binding cassette subfamily B protein RaxB
LYRRPDILFLDEATSHLDEATEAIIVESLRELDMTRVVIAHRPATIAHADVVISLPSLNDGVASEPDTTARASLAGPAHAPCGPAAAHLN